MLYPLRFAPIFQHYLWGGRKLATLLGKQFGDRPTCAESWEICDHDADQSRVLAGPLQGTTLADLVREHGAELLGRHAPQPRFPLLFKFLDAAQTLSVQVHPDDARGARLTPPDLGKTEAWVVLDVEPGALVYAGLKRGFDRQSLARELSRGTAELCLHHFTPAVGDCIFIPAGMVHALGAGLVVAEIQQASNTTYRLFDWNRVGPDGKPRALHIEAGLEAIDERLGPGDPQTPQATADPDLCRLVSCDKFVLDRLSFAGARSIGGDGSPHILAVLSGQVRVAGDPVAAPLTKGSTLLVPAGLGAVQVEAQGPALLLDAYLP